jgi:hypothetical protein
VPLELRPDPAGVNCVDEDTLVRVPARGLARDENVAELGLPVQAHRPFLRAGRAGSNCGVVDVAYVGGVGRGVYDARASVGRRCGGAGERRDEQLLQQPVALRAWDEIAERG